jgi:predicted amidohydrolase YtcJ
MVVDLGGRALLPGFVDAHGHVLNDYFGPTALARDLSLAERQDVLLEHGITTHGSLFVKPALLDELHAFDAAGDLRVRVSAYLAYNDACAQIRSFPDPDIPDPFWWEDVPPTRTFGELLRIGGVKVFADGANCRIPPFFSRPLVAGVDPGTPFVTLEELTGIIERAGAAGHQVATHAIGDGAVDLVLDALEAGLDGAPNALRHRIEHSAVLRLWDTPEGPRQLERFGALDVVATVFADWPSCTVLAPTVVEGFEPWEWAYRELVDANPGLHVAWSGDAPTFDVDPLHQLFGFVTRHDVGPDSGICPPPPDKAGGTFSPDEALRMMTVESAFSLFRETEVGSLAPGMLADLVVVSGDPTTVDPMALPELEVRMTMVGGGVEFCADPADDVCPAGGG